MALGVEPCHSSLSWLMRLRDDVADEERVAVFRREMVGGVVDDARDGRSSRGVCVIIAGPKPRPSCGLPKLG